MSGRADRRREPKLVLHGRSTMGFAEDLCDDFKTVFLTSEEFLQTYSVSQGTVLLNDSKDVCEFNG
jgi:hypothetical protein